MKPVYRTLAWLTVRSLAWLFWAPVAFAVGAVFREVVGDTIPCGTCSSQIQLLGLWVCGGCGYSRHGWVFLRCEGCGGVPPLGGGGGRGGFNQKPPLFWGGASPGGLQPPISVPQKNPPTPPPT